MLYSVRHFPANRLHASLACVVFWIESLGWLAWDIATGHVTSSCESEEKVIAQARMRRWAA